MLVGIKCIKQKKVRIKYNQVLQIGPCLCVQRIDNLPASKEEGHRPVRYQISYTAFKSRFLYRF
jgi:hypothetical protein